jgi:hypothetical protein
MRTHGHSLI